MLVAVKLASFFADVSNDKYFWYRASDPNVGIYDWA